jgi:CheY-like chemotaxis protein
MANASADRPVVLIVEDDPLQMMVTEDLVEEAGFDSVVAANADQAIAILERRNDIRIVLTDVNMPGSMDGLRLAAVVRDRWPPVELVVVSRAVLAEHVQLPERSLFFQQALPARSDGQHLAKACPVACESPVRFGLLKVFRPRSREPRLRPAGKSSQAFFDSSPTTAG